MTSMTLSMKSAAKLSLVFLLSVFILVANFSFSPGITASAECLPFRIVSIANEVCSVSFAEPDSSPNVANSARVDRICATYDAVNRVITVTCDSTLSEVESTINNHEILRKETDDGVWFLNSSLVISKDAVFRINSSDASWLKISSDGRSTGIRGIQAADDSNQITPYLIQVFGKLYVDGVKITSWDPISNNYTGQVQDGSVPRPYISIETGAGPCRILGSEIAYLGYNSPRKQGINFYGGDGSIIANNQIHHLWFGFYSDSVSNITIEANHVHSNSKYGLDPHSGTHDMLITNNRVNDNGHIGIICSADCTNMTIDGNIVYNNTNAGIMVSRNVRDSTVRNNNISGENTGISISESHNNLIYSNGISNTSSGIQVKLISSNNSIYDNSLYRVKKCGIEISSGASSNTIFSNDLLQSGNYGVCLFSNPVGNILSNNTISSNQDYAIYIKDSNSSTNVFKHNKLLNVAQNPIKIANGTLTVVDNIVK